MAKHIINVFVFVELPFSFSYESMKQLPTYICYHLVICEVLCALSGSFVFLNQTVTRCWTDIGGT